MCFTSDNTFEEHVEPSGEEANRFRTGCWKSSSLSDSDITICFALFGRRSFSGMAYTLRLPIFQNLNPMRY